MSRIIIVCGGTGGHLAPGIAVAEVLQGRGHSCLLLISEKQVDSALVQKYEHLTFRKMPGRAFSGGLLSRLAFLVSLVSGMRYARKLVREESPDVILLFGGFLSVALGLVGRLSRVPVVLHEANAVPGRAVRLLKHLAERIYLPDGVRLKGIEPARVRYFGYPVRREIKHIFKAQAWEKLGIKAPHKLLVVIGGSQGAQALNDWVVQHFEQMAERGISVYCVTGLAKDTARLVGELPGGASGCSATMVPFSDRMGDVISAADLVISRAGAGSIAEIIRCRAPAILIPYPYAADDHQWGNARLLEQHGAGLVLGQNSLGQLWPEVEELMFNDWLLARFKTNLERLDRFESSERIASDLEQLCGPHQAIRESTPEGVTR
ncbi:MAG: UDP-N-acetylglucosamine--N-acetylmuramyl-(pentapeptide) pyrophosphoryl-undecaprenol N-acetylglucosamine transferase [Opitutales bacterium]